MKLGCLYEFDAKDELFLSLLEDQGFDLHHLTDDNSSTFEHKLNSLHYCLIFLDYDQEIDADFEEKMDRAAEALGIENVILIIAHQVEGEERSAPVRFAMYRYLEYGESLISKIECLFSICRKTNMPFSALSTRSELPAVFNEFDPFLTRVNRDAKDVYIIPQLLYQLSFEYRQKEFDRSFHSFVYFVNVCRFYSLEPGSVLLQKMFKIYQNHAVKETALYFSDYGWQQNKIQHDAFWDESTPADRSSIFISFSSRDRKFAQDIMAGLAQHNLTFWDYSDQIEEIEASENIPKRLFDEIDACSIFILLISSNSVDPDRGHFTRMEVEYFVKAAAKKTKLIVPIIIEERAPEKLSPPFDFIKNRREDLLVFKTADRQQQDQILIELCDRLGVDYRPLIVAHRRLPFAEFFRDEIHAFIDDHADVLYQNSLHVRLNRILAQFNDAFKNDDIARAYFLITLFLQTIHHHNPQAKLFYPWIVKAVCERKLGLTKRAIGSYEEAGRIRPDDENYYGGLGGVYYEMQEVQKAKEYYRKAVQVCPLYEDTDEILNYVNCLLALNEPVPEMYEKRILEISLDEYADAKMIVLTTQGILLYKRRDRDSVLKAVAIFESLEKEQLAGTAAIAFHVNCLVGLEKREKAKGLLLNALEWSKKNNLIEEKYIRSYLNQF